LRNIHFQEGLLPTATALEQHTLTTNLCIMA